jgi:hypothetical protein
MRLSNAQLDTIKAWITANVVNATEHTAQAALNATASPAYKVYRTSVLRQTILENGFDWTRLDNLSVGKARVWSDIFVVGDEGGRINPSKANVRAGINAVWVGTAPDLAVRATVYGHCVKDASEFEKLLKADGNGTAPDQSGDGPATMAFEGPITLDEVIAAMNRP